MLFSNIKEMKAFVPTMKWAEGDTSYLLTLLGEEEEYLAQHYLGYALHDHLCAKYKEHAEQGGVGSDVIPNPDITVKVILDCQRIVLFSMLDHNADLFALSFNKGGGLNQMTANDYESAREDQTEKFKTSAYRKARRNIESLLLHLEQDAKGEQLMTELWKESETYYLNKDLLFTTAHDLQCYLFIENSRDRYLQLVPAIRRNQMTYIANGIGQPMLKYLLEGRWAKGNDNDDDNDDSTNRLNDETVNLPAPLTQLDLDVLDLLKHSLAQYIDADERSRQTAKSATERGSIDKTVQDLREEGKRHLMSAQRLIIANADTYDRFFYTGSPLSYAFAEEMGTPYIPVAERSEEKEDGTTEVTPVNIPENTHRKYDRHNQNNAVFDMGGFRHRR